MGRMDDIYQWQICRRSEYIAGVREREIDVAFNAALPGLDTNELIPELWVDDIASTDLTLRGRWHIGSIDDSYWFIRPSILGGFAGDENARGFGKLELALGRVKNVNENLRVSVRAFGGAAFGDAPPQRALYLSAADPVSRHLRLGPAQRPALGHLVGGCREIRVRLAVSRSDRPRASGAALSPDVLVLGARWRGDWNQ